MKQALLLPSVLVFFVPGVFFPPAPVAFVPAEVLHRVVEAVDAPLHTLDSVINGGRRSDLDIHHVTGLTSGQADCEYEQ